MPAAQVALAWLVDRPGVTSVVVGARTATQLAENLATAAFRLGAEELDLLEAVSDPGAAGYPYGPFGTNQRTRPIKSGRTPL